MYIFSFNKADEFSYVGRDVTFPFMYRNILFTARFKPLIIYLLR